MDRNRTSGLAWCNRWLLHGLCILAPVRAQSLAVDGRPAPSTRFCLSHFSAAHCVALAADFRCDMARSHGCDRMAACMDPVLGRRRIGPRAPPPCSPRLANVAQAHTASPFRGLIPQAGSPKNTQFDSFHDSHSIRARFLLLGSASLDLVRGVSESLADRVALVEMDGFSLGEVGAEDQAGLWLRGGYPRSFLARSEGESVQWRVEFVRTFLERDIPQLGLGVPALALRRFWMMVSHFHGGIWNAAAFARSLGTSEPTARTVT